jgi:hypothetical protein
MRLNRNVWSVSVAAVLMIAFCVDARGAEQWMTAQAGVPAMRTGPMVNQPAVKQPPPPALVAHPGRNQVVFVTQTVTLNGCASGPVAKGGVLTYHWSLSTVPTGSRSAGTVAPARLCPPARRTGNIPVAPPPCLPLPACQATFVVDMPGHYVATLKVGDGKQLASASTSIDTMNSPPVASASVAGGSPEVGIGTTVQLDGSRSHDVDGDRLAYKWSLASAPPQSAAALRFHDTCVQWRPVAQAASAVKAGPGVGASSPAQECVLHKTETSIPNPTLQVDRAGRYEVRLVVSDGKADSAPAILKIDAGPAACGADDGKTLFTWRAPDPAKDKLCARGTPVNIRKVADPVADANRPDFGSYEWTCQAGGTHVSCFAGGALVLTVDGLAPGPLVTGGLVKSPDDLYLCKRIFWTAGKDDWPYRRDQCEKNNGSISYVRTSYPAITLVPFPWDRNPWRTDAHVGALRGYLQNLAKVAGDYHKKLVVVAHSWGTVLSYLALASAQAAEAQGGQHVRVDLLVMLSSPLATENVDYRSAALWCPVLFDPIAISACVIAEGGANALYDDIILFTDGWRFQQNPSFLTPRVGSVYNYWAWNDCISGPLNSLPALSGPFGGFTPGAVKLPGAAPARGPLAPAFAALDGGPLFVNDNPVDIGDPDFNDVNKDGQRNSKNVALTPKWHNGYTSFPQDNPADAGLRSEVEGHIWEILQ